MEKAVGFYSQGISKKCSVNSVSRSDVAFLYVPMLQYTKGAYTNGVPIPVPTQGWAVHHVARIAQSREYTGIGGKCLHLLVSRPECYTGLL